ncbi:MAG: hypothetical protein MUE42_06550 [Opitutaceae bacterium]|jgi:hypothetical protein|nr:hypothetical protein [Opitutaceae bacterium]
MKRVIPGAMGLFLAMAWAGGSCANAEATPPVVTWTAEWSNRFAGEGGVWVFALTVREGVVSGTVLVEGVSYAVEGMREGTWWELTWKNAAGRVTQVRAAGGEAEWRGTVLSGGDGGLVAYARMRARRTE